MTVRKSGSDTHLCFIRILYSRTNDRWSSVTITPGNLLLTAYCMKRAMRRQFPDIHWKIRWRHHWGYNLLNIQSSQVRSKEVNMRTFFKKRQKKRHAEQVIVMTMRNQKRNEQWFSLGAAQQFVSQADDPTTSVQDQRMSTNLYLNTRRIAPVAKRIRPRSRITSPYSPKANSKIMHVGHNITPAPPWKTVVRLPYYILRLLKRPYPTPRRSYPTSPLLLSNKCAMIHLSLEDPLSKEYTSMAGNDQKKALRLAGRV